MMNILFITANRLGDAILTTGVLDWLARRYPEARFTIACGPYAADLFRATPRLERLIVMPKQSLNRHWLKLGWQCFGTRWTMIVDFRNSIVSRLLAADRLAVARRLPGRHKIIENAAILEIDPPPAPHIRIDQPSMARAAALLPTNRPILALGPAANWAAKQWPLERFAALAQRLSTSDGPLGGAAVMIVAGEKERGMLAPLLQALPKRQVIEMIGEDLQMVAACLQKAQLYVGNDSGLMHLAAAVGTPTVGLFGPGYEQIYGPWGKHGMVVRTPESREELLKRLPAKGRPPPNLMEGLSVQAVYDAALAHVLKGDFPSPRGRG